MDFSDMFRPDAGRPVSKPRLNTAKRTPAAAEETQVQQENQPPKSNIQSSVSLADSESLAYIKNSLRNMNFDIQEKDLTQPAVRAIEMLYSEVVLCCWCTVFSVIVMSSLIYSIQALLLAKSKHFRLRGVCEAEEPTQSRPQGEGGRERHRGSTQKGRESAFYTQHGCLSKLTLCGMWHGIE